MADMGGHEHRLNVMISAEHLYLLDELRKQFSPLPGRSEMVRRMIVDLAAAKGIINPTLANSAAPRRA